MKSIFLIICALLSGNMCETILDGHITVAGLFQIQNDVNEKCSGIAPLSVKILEAVKWTFMKLNQNNFIERVSIGLDAWPTCQLTVEASDRTVDLIYRIREDKNDQTFSNSPVVALLGPALSGEAQKSSDLLSSQRPEDRLLQIGISSTASSLSNSDIYKNFFRVVPSDAIQTQVMVSLMTDLQWNYIAIIYDNDTYGTEGKNSISKLAAETGICIGAVFSIPSGAVSLNYLRTILQNIIQNSESPISGAVVFASDSHVTSIMSVATSLKNEITDPLSFIFSEAVGLSDNFFKNENGDLYDAAKGVYVISPPQVQINEFELYWNDIMKNVSILIEQSKSNKWLRDVYGYYSGCTPSTDSKNPGCSQLSDAELKSASQTSSWVNYAVKSAYVVGKVLKNSHSNLCSGSGLCTAMKNVLFKNKGKLIEMMADLSINFNFDFPFVPEALQNISMVFPGIHDARYQQGFPDYEVYQYRKCLEDQSSFCFEKIGTYNDSALLINKTLIMDYNTNANGNLWPNVNKAQCAEGRKCSSCISQNIYDQVFFKDGDLLVGGIVPVYDKGLSNPLSCGDIRTSLGTELVQAMEYAVEIINNKSHSFDSVYPGKTIGFVILNSCNQRLLIQNKLIGLHKDGLILANGQVVDVNKKMIGYIGPYASALSIAASDILSQFQFIQISYASTAVALSDRTLYPYFMRVCTPDDKQAKAMIKIIRNSLYKTSSYIQVVYSAETYGEAGLHAIREAAKLNGVCIANEIRFEDGDNKDALIDKLRVHSFARIVIIFIVSQLVPDVTKSLNDRMDYGEFMFIGSEAWGFRPNEFIDKQKLVGSLVLTLQLPENANFTQYLQNTDVFGKTNNPWFQQYIENKFNCHTETSFDKSFSKLCPSNLQLGSDGYQQELWTPFAFNAMLALLSGSSEAFRDLCGLNSATLCDQFKLNTKTIISKIKNHRVDIDGSGQQVRLFDDNGEGVIGYTIYNLQTNKDNANQVIYKKVGTYLIEEETVALDTQSIVYPDRMQFPSVCPNVKACEACQGDIKPGNPIGDSEESNAAVPALGALVGILLVLVIILVVVIIIIYRKHKARETDVDTYLDVFVDGDLPRLYSSPRNSVQSNTIINQHYDSECHITKTSSTKKDRTTYLDPISMSGDSGVDSFDKHSNKSELPTSETDLKRSLGFTAEPKVSMDNLGTGSMQTATLSSSPGHCTPPLQDACVSEQQNELATVAFKSESPQLFHPVKKPTQVAVVPGVPNHNL